MIKPVVLCGGSGTRLWPLSREDFPKQFVPLIEVDGELRNPLDLTLERAGQFGTAALCVGSERHRFLLKEAMEKAGVDGRQILEPEGRSTAAAMACAALYSAETDLLLFLPADQYVGDNVGFAAMVQGAVEVAEQGWIVTFGVEPTSPSSAYGYILVGPPVPGHRTARVAERFIEKPSQTKADALFQDGKCQWNAGMFLVRADVLIRAFETHAPDVLEACRSAVSESMTDGSFLRPDTESFLSCRDISIDYAVMEAHERIAVIPFDGVWSDLGTWSAVAAMSNADDAGNRVVGRGLAIDATNTYIDARHRSVVVLGADNLIVVDTPDAVLVAGVDHADKIKDVVARMREHGEPEATTHRRVVRPWGWHDTTDRGERFLVRRLVVKSGGRLSLQKHAHRAEHWVVVKGVARVTNGDQVMDLRPNESTYIPVGTVHRLENLGNEELEIIEVQTGDLLSEEDIVRLEDVYGREGS